MNERHCIDVVGLFGDADAPTFWIELDGRVGWANEKARQITLAVTGREVRPGASMELFAVGDSLEPFRKSFARALAGESVVSRRHIEYPSGVGFFWEVRYVPTRASSGEITGVLFTANNQSVATEATARALLLERALDAAPVGASIARCVGPDRTEFVYVNAAFEQLTGYSSAEVLGRESHLLDESAEDVDAAAALRDAIVERRSITVTLRDRRKDGTTFWNRLTVSPLRGADGQVTHYVGIQRDVSVEIEALREQRAVERERILADVLSGTAHDVANLVTIVTMSVPLIQEDAEVTTAFRQLAERAVGGLRRLVRASRVEANRFEARAVLRGMQPLLSQSLAGQGELVLDVGGVDAEVAFPQATFERIVLGLVRNASHALRGRAEGLVWVRARVDMGALLVSVVDEGELSLAVRASVLETAPEDPALLSLAVARRELRDVGGELRCFARGNDVCFELRLPLAHGSEELPETAMGGTERLWLIERDPAVARSVGRVLETLGYRVVVSEDAAHAPNEVDVVVADLLSGALRIVHGEVPALRRTPVLVLSADLLERPAALPPGAPGLGFLHKPFSSAQLDAAIRALVGSRRD
ncbi:MAG: PAS domain S-box protein [Sandaracinus sp.]|nr:PAS domain S-box protein [Sandaracinus sp.]